MLSGAVLLLVVASLPSLGYVVVHHRRGTSTKAAVTAVGLGPGTARGWGLSLAVGLGILALAYVAIQQIPREALDEPGVVIARATTVGGVAAVLLQTLAEEVFFRGFLAGLLIRRLGFALGNLEQSFVFIAPHCLLLLSSASLWPVLPVQLLAGWLAGWLRHRTDSIGPGWLAHTAANLLAALLL